MVKTTELREAARNIQGNLGRCLYRRKDVDEMQKVSDLLFEAADTIESIGNDTPTVEQVREAIAKLRQTVRDAFNKTHISMLEEGYAIMRAIDDVEAAGLGSGTCNPVETETLENVTAHVMECDECGGTYEHVNGEYERCPRCWRKAAER